MKHPNGYGSVFKLSGKRRKPFGARVTIGWEMNEETGKVVQKYKPIGYYKSRPEAMIALAEYNKNPYDIDDKKVTFEEIFDLWSAEKFPGMGKKSVSSYKSAFKHSWSLHHQKFIDIKKLHMQSVIDDCEKGHPTKAKIKGLFNQLSQFALENDVTEKDYSKFVTLPANNSKSKRKPFSTKEIDILWNNIDRCEFADTVLIMIYSGLRPGELILIENENINIQKRYMIGGIKTQAGKNRIIPIHKKILPLIEKRKNKENKFLIVNNKGNKMSYETYRKARWIPLMDELNLKHDPHDCRHTFATMMDNENANITSIKRIMGHSSQDVTDKVYTHKDIDQLIKAIDLI